MPSGATFEGRGVKTQKIDKHPLYWMSIAFCFRLWDNLR